MARDRLALEESDPDSSMNATVFKIGEVNIGGGRQRATGKTSMKCEFMLHLFSKISHLCSETLRPHSCYSSIPRRTKKMSFNPSKFFVSAAVAISMGSFAVPFGAVADATTVQEGLSHSRGWMQLAADDSKVEEKTEQKSTQSTDSSGMPQANTHTERETTQKASDDNGSAKTQNKAEVNESTNAMGDTTKESKQTTKSSQDN
jgi:hypothetical protein